MPAAFSLANWIDSAVSITCVGEQPTQPASRLAVAAVARRFRVAGLGPGNTRRRVRVDFGTARPIERIFLVRPRRNSKVEALEGPVFAPTDLVRHTLANDVRLIGDDADFAAATKVYDSDWIASGMRLGVGYHDHVVPRLGGAKRTARYACLEFDALSRATAPDNFVDFGRAGWCEMQGLAIGHAAPFSYGWRDRATATRSLDGAAEHVNDRTRGWREWQVVFRSVKSNEWDAVLDFLERTRTGGRFFFVLDAAVADPLRCLVARNLTPDLDQTDRAFSRFELSLRESF